MKNAMIVAAELTSALAAYVAKEPEVTRDGRSS